MEVMDTEQDAPSEQRLVHLDLKGAPPKISYYEKIFPLLSKWGATGLLVEYEDMFPYSGEIKELAARNVYSVEEIKSLQSLAQINNLSVIPLIQTFGHMEFVLKHDKFRHLREIEQFPMAICPLIEGSLSLITSMIDQVVELHPDICAFHIGADEVFHLGVCARCQKHMAETSSDKARLFFGHVKSVLEYIRSKHPAIRPIMWDDMFRDVDLPTLRDSGISDLVEPMVWYYTKQLPKGTWDTYAEVFPNIWAASAFKGATGPCMVATDVSYHLENHEQWLKVIREQIRPKFKTFRGICITGWSRYDHYAVLCELLPASLPSLAVCLYMYIRGFFNEDVHLQASKELGFTQCMIPLNPFQSSVAASQSNFPGSAVYTAIHTLLGLRAEHKYFAKSESISAWMTPYHIKHNFTNPAHLQHFLPQAQDLLERYKKLESELRAALSEIFYPDMVDEWLLCVMAAKIEKFGKTVKNVERLMAVGAKPKDFSETSMNNS